jgi:UDP-N-acetylmuramoylalanine--D-glutamate ligase
VIKSPGVPREAPVIQAALQHGITVIGWPNGVTAGNVGTPLASLVGKLDLDATVICECSSFQLEDTIAFAPECAVLLNVEEDHLDRHGTFDAYREAKERVFANQGTDDVAVLPPEYADRAIPGDGRRVDYADFADFVDASALRLRGPHNRLNAMAAAAAALSRGVPEDVVRAGLRDFAGVPNRLEEVAEHDGVLFVNDSKATNVASAVVGIESFPGGVHVILGGSLKGGGYSGLRDPVAARAKAVYLIGQAAEQIRADLDGVGIPLHDSGDLATAVASARAAAEPGDVVLLSPACASFDQFKNYEARGEEFRRLAG